MHIPYMSLRHPETSVHQNNKLDATTLQAMKPPPLSRNPLFTLWQCTVAGADEPYVIPVVEYFNGAVYVPVEWRRNYSRDIQFINPQQPFFAKDIQWLKMNSGLPADLVHGIPL